MTHHLSGYSIAWLCLSWTAGCGQPCPTGKASLGDSCIDVSEDPFAPAMDADGGPTCRVHTYYRDQDGDFHGDPTVPSQGCVAPVGYVEDSTDCDDSRPDVSPSDAEICDGVDNDCDGVVDEDGLSLFHPDADGDGFGDPATSIEGCEAPDGYVDDGTDCDDSCSDCFPGADELCDDLDNDCDGTADDGLPFTTWYSDCDGDGFAPAGAASISVCREPTTSACGGGWVATAPTSLGQTDCDDAEEAAFPGSTLFRTYRRAGGGFDWNCDGVETLKFTGHDATSCACVGLTESGSWVGSAVPPCGASDQLFVCQYTASIRRCIAAEVRRTQACR